MSPYISHTNIFISNFFNTIFTLTTIILRWFWLCGKMKTSSEFSQVENYIIDVQRFIHKPIVSQQSY